MPTWADHIPNTELKKFMALGESRTHREIPGEAGWWANPGWIVS
jgi:hypothetical protein